MSNERELSNEELQAIIDERNKNLDSKVEEQLELKIVNVNEKSEVTNYDDLPVTSLETLKNYAKGKKVRFPDFGEGQPFVARVTRPSLLVLSKQGKIPNSLLASATAMFTGSDSEQTSSEDQINMLAQMYDVASIVADAALVEPTMADFKEAGIELSDEQLMAIFNYAQQGVKALDTFRTE